MQTQLPEQTVTLSEINQFVTVDLAAVNSLILHSLHSDISLIELIGKRIIDSGGKRIRPLLVLLCAKLFDYSGKEHIRLAAIIEFVHTATLLHDDVVDSSELRRGKKTANAVWGNQASVLVGDFLYSRAFQMIADLNNSAVMQVLSYATNQLAEGEVMQLINRQRLDLSEADYLEVIRRKTAMLFSAACEIGAIIAGADMEQRRHLAQYGLHLGNAFQMIDDLLDYCSSADEIGKNVGDDLAEGKLTLPLLYIMQQGTAAQRQKIQQSMGAATPENLKEILVIIQESGALQYTLSCAHAQVEQAKKMLHSFHDTKHRQALENLADFAVQRQF